MAENGETRPYVTDKHGRVDVTTRAISAFFRRSNGFIGDAIPIEHEGRTYVRLVDPTKSTLAIYRVRASGALKRLKRWPAAVEDTSWPRHSEKMGAAA